MELINRDALEVATAKVPKGMDAKSYMAGMEYVLGQIDAMPTIEERKTGKWIYQTKFGRIECGVCGYVFRSYVYPRNYCPNCGARMEGVGNEQVN